MRTLMKLADPAARRYCAPQCPEVDPFSNHPGRVAGKPMGSLKKEGFSYGKSHKRDKARGKVPTLICQKE